MKNATKAYLALGACNAIWAMDYPFYKIIMPHYVSPLTMVTTAVVVAALLSLTTLPFSKHETVEPKDRLKLIGAALLAAVLRKVFLMEGLARTSPIDGAIIDTVSPIIVLIISVIIHIERFSPGKLIGVILGMGGAIMAILFGASDAHGASDIRGNLMVLMCAFVSALYLIWFKSVVAKYSPLTVMRWVYCFGALFILPFGLHDVIHTDYSSFTTQAWWAYLFVILIPTFGPNLLLAWSLKFVQPTASSMFSYLQPIGAATISVAMGLDKLHWDTGIAAIVIFTGVYLVIRSYSDHRAAPSIPSPPMR